MSRQIRLSSSTPHLQHHANATLPATHIALLCPPGPRFQHTSNEAIGCFPAPGIFSPCTAVHSSPRTPQFVHYHEVLHSHLRIMSKWLSGRPRNARAEFCGVFHVPKGFCAKGVTLVFHFHQSTVLVIWGGHTGHQKCHFAGSYCILGLIE